MEEFEIAVKFQKETFIVELPAASTLAHLRVKLYEKSLVRPEQQKLMGVKFGGKAPSDDQPLSELTWTKTKGVCQVMLMGTPEHKMLKEPGGSSVKVFNDLALDFKPDAAFLIDHYGRDGRLKTIISENRIITINPLDSTKKLLVLDLDKTLLHFSSRHKTNSVHDTMRPFLREFLTACYAHYNLAVWSATNWTWVEIKLTELGLLQNDFFKFSFVLDESTMIQVKTQERKDVVKDQEVKPLAFIWHHLPQFSRSNTVHVDDLQKNFEMNPENGIIVSQFKVNATSASDVELLLLAKYLTKIARVDDVSALDHSKWRDIATTLS